MSLPRKRESRVLSETVRYCLGALMLYSYDTSIAVEKVAQKEIKQRTKGCTEMLGLESVTLFVILVSAVYAAGCGLIGMTLAKRNDLESLGPLGGFWSARR